MHLPELRFGRLVSRLPIIQGGMGVGISLSGLASAVADQGAVGVIAAAMIGIDEPEVTTDPAGADIRALIREIRAARRKTRGVLGVNIMVALTNFRELVLAAVAEGIDVIFCGAGLPLNLPGLRAKGSRTKLVPIVSSARAAVLICKKWLATYDTLPDGIVVEGPQAGGHLGFSTEQLDDPAYALPKIIVETVRAVKPFETARGRPVPVVAAGGVYTGSDIRDMLRLGACGVQMGTRFVATHECDADQAFKQAYIDARREDLVVIKSPVGMPGRAIGNGFIDRVNAGRRKPFRCPYHCVRTCDHRNSPYCIAMALACAKKGKLKNGFAFAGANAHRVKRIVSVKSLIASLKAEYRLACTGATPGHGPVRTPCLPLLDAVPA